MWPRQVPDLVQAFTNATLLSSSHHRHLLESPSSVTNAPSQIQSFAISVPLVPESLKPVCSSTLVENLEFAFSFGKPFVGSYSPPACIDSDWNKVLLRFESRVSGRQFDRTGAVWLFGVELLRFTTQEPSGSRETFWSVEKDITKVANLLKANQSLVLALDNLVNDVYTGIFNTSLYIDFYKDKSSSSNSETENPADIVIPLSASTTTYGWFLLPVGKEPLSVPLSTRIPRNTIHAEIEVFWSAHGKDEFWYGNVPNAWASEEGGYFGGGSFKQLGVTIDTDAGNSTVVGIDTIYPTIYTGGMNPMMWRPVVSIGTFDVPTSVFDITPFLPLISDASKNHSIGLNISVDANPTWYVSARLQLWTRGSPDYSGPLKGNIMDYRVQLGQPNEVLSHVSNGNKTSRDSLIALTRGSASLSVSSRLYLSDESSFIVNLERSVDFHNNVTLWNNNNTQTFDVHSSIKQHRRLLYQDKRGLPVGIDDVSYVAEYPLKGSLTSQMDSSNGTEFLTDIKLGRVETWTSRVGDMMEGKQSASDVLRKRGIVAGQHRQATSPFTTTRLEQRLDASGLFSRTRTSTGAHRQTLSYVSPAFCYSRDVSVAKREVVTDAVSSDCPVN